MAEFFGIHLGDWLGGDPSLHVVAFFRYRLLRGRVGRSAVQPNSRTAERLSSRRRRDDMGRRALEEVLDGTETESGTRPFFRCLDNSRCHAARVESPRSEVPECGRV